MKWAKMSAGGNVFLITHVEPGFKNKNLQLACFAPAFCAQHKTDGLAVLFPPRGKNITWEWLFCNKDGSPASMCGNAACAAVEYVCGGESSPPLKTGRGRKRLKKDFRLRTEAGIVKGSFKNKAPKIFIAAKMKLSGPFFTPFEDKAMGYMGVSGLVPHAVVKLYTLYLDRLPIYLSFARHLRGLRELSPEGMNVTFFEVKGPKKLKAAVFERGVENITGSCGTGALAAAFVYRKSCDSPPAQVSVRMPKGTLLLEFPKSGGVWLQSPVKKTAVIQTHDFKN